jgi:hypothetical protein
MRRSAWVIIVIAVLGPACLASAANARQTPLPETSLADFLVQLDRLESAVDQLDERSPERVAFVLAAVPRTWLVVASRARFEVSSGWLRRALTDWRTKPDVSARTLIVERLRAIRSDAAAFEQAPDDVSAMLARLRAVLSDPAFRFRHGPTWLDRLRQRALLWFIRLLGRALGSSAVPTVTNAIVYALIGLVVVLVAVWTYRAVRRSAALDMETVVPDRIPLAARPWTVWLTDARVAAAEDRWPEAIHFVYWCGISFLEGQGAWRPDRSRTPREYLGLLASSHDRRPALHALTRLLEHVWYGTDAADASSFDEALAELRKLGCPPL